MFRLRLLYEVQVDKADLLPHLARMTLTHAETICALASGAPPSGIAVIRVSGLQVKAFGDAHIQRGLPVPHFVRLRKLCDAMGELIDEALTLYMPAGASYTGEDVLELHLHGGVAVIDHALETLCSFPGIRLAEPGEFTRRAFEAGRMDLTQAEGIADLIEAETRGQKAQALAQAEGAIGRLYSVWRESLLGALAQLEVSIDFPDEAEAPETVNVPVKFRLSRLIEEFEIALKDGHLQQSVREGFRVAIIGAPNVGKSTLLNRLARKEAAIVTDIPGTTRDVVEVRCRMAGQIVWFADTAGLRDTLDRVEAEGVRRARRVAEEADLRLFIEAGAEANAVCVTEAPSPRPGDIFVRNKSDLTVNEVLKPDTLCLSALTGAGFETLETALENWLRAQTGAVAAPVITRARHRAGIERALMHVRAAITLINEDAGAELVSEDVRLAARALGGLLGEIGVEEILGAVFSEFCIGK